MNMASSALQLQAMFIKNILLLWSHQKKKPYTGAWVETRLFIDI